MSSLDFQTCIEVTRARQSGDQWMGHCPAHDDKKPSLSIKDDNGKAVLNCFAGCDFKSVENAFTGLSSQNSASIVKKNSIETKHLSFDTLSVDHLKQLVETRFISKSVIGWANLGSKGQRIAIPIYNQVHKQVDLRSHLLKIYRNGSEPKVVGAKGAAATLYPLKLLSDLHEVGNLDHLDILEDNTILVVEGELDALTMLSNGVLAITNTSGAGKWTEEFSQIIKSFNRKVVILLDNDESGKNGAVKRADSLKGIGVPVSIAKWPVDRNVGHDVTDEIESFGIQSLKKIIDGAEPSRSVITMNEVTTEDIDWIVHPYIAKRKITLLEGDPGIGKSYLALHFAAQLSIVQKEKSLLISLEDGLADTIKPRLLKFTCDLSRIIAPKETVPLDANGIRQLEGILFEERPTLVILDTLTAVSAGRDNNKSSEMRPFLAELNKLAERFSAGFLILRHLNKKVGLGEEHRGAGSTDIGGIARSILQVNRDQNDKSLAIVNHIKCNIAKKAEPFGFRLPNGVFEMADHIPKETPTKEIDRAVQFLCAELIGGPLPALVMATKGATAGFSEATLNRAKKKAMVRSRQIKGADAWEWYLKD